MRSMRIAMCQKGPCTVMQPVLTVHWVATANSMLCYGLPSAITPRLTMKYSYISLSFYITLYLCSAFSHKKSSKYFGDAYTLSIQF